MCLSLPAQVISIESDRAIVDTGARQMCVGRIFVPEVRPGDWVLIYAGQIQSLVEPKEVEAIRELLREITALDSDEEAGGVRLGG